MHTTLAADLAPVLMDQGQLEQVLVNLAVNARDAMPGGGTLHLSTWAAALPPAEAADREAPGGWVVISAQDTGHGIAPAVRERIFEPFFTTKPTGEGTGLGLAVSYANVTAAGGCLTVTSRPGDGARFEVWLPAAPNRVPAARTAPGDTGTVRGGTESVLVVEDEDALRRLIVRTLGDAGYTITVAEDGQAAIDRLAAPGARFDLVVTDRRHAQAQRDRRGACGAGVRAGGSRTPHDGLPRRPSHLGGDRRGDRSTAAEAVLAGRPAGAHSSPDRSRAQRPSIRSSRVALNSLPGRHSG